VTAWVAHLLATIVRVHAFVGDVRNTVAFVDTNVRRVLHRLFFGPEAPAPAATRKELLSTAETLVPSGRAWKWGQSVIEFGALHCTARKPLCESCPVSNLCVARPAIRASLASLPRGGRVTGGYEGSNRYYRGRVLAVLREASRDGVPLRELGEGLREGFGAEELPWLYGVLESLEKDGLARLWFAKDHPRAVAEERAAYGVDRQGGSIHAPVRVSLP
jgi:A/G-specific adenine glycosylase